MAEELLIDSTLDKAARYEQCLPQIKALIADEPNAIANLANTAAALKQFFGFLWVGFYVVENDSLVLGPFQGPIACTRIAKGKGVCGTAWQEKKTQVVPDVDAFPGHIACSSDSRSEIVVPIFDANNEVKAILDIDSSSLNTFDATDQKYLEALCRML